MPSDKRPTDADAPLLVIDGLSKSYGPIKAVDGVALDMRQGEFLTILGPSGCGKTTLLRMIAGFTSIDEGRITVGGKDVTRLQPGSRNIGMVFQSYALFPHMSVYRNVAYSLRMRRTPRAEIRQRVDEVLRMVDLSAMASRLPSELSGGQQQRVALARAIVFRPNLLLLDEPFSALDRKLRTRLQDEIKLLQRELKLTTIFITHDQEEALVMSDRIAVMHGGMIRQIESPKALYDGPNSAFVATFLGEMNQIPLAGADKVIEAMGASPATGNGQASRARVHRFDNTLFFRPEDVSIEADHPSSGNANGLRGTISSTSYLGGAVRYLVTLGDGVQVLAKHPVSGAEQLLEPGQSVSLRLRAGVTPP